MARGVRRSSAVWEADLLPLDARIGRPGQRGERALAGICADRHQGIILNMEACTVARPLNMASFLMECVRRSGFLPAEIRVHRRDLRAALEPLAAALGLRLRRSTRLPVLESALKGFAEYAGR